MSLAFENPAPVIGWVCFHTCRQSPLVIIMVPSAAAAPSQHNFAMNLYFFAMFFIVPSPSPCLILPGSWYITTSAFISFAYIIASFSCSVFTFPVPACRFTLISLHPVVSGLRVMSSPMKLPLLLSKLSFTFSSSFAELLIMSASLFWSSYSFSSFSPFFSLAVREWVGGSGRFGSGGSGVGTAVFFNI